MWFRFFSKIARMVDPKLDKYREKKKPVVYTPSTLPEFISLVRRTPKTVLSLKDRERIAAVMSFEGRKVEDMMTPKKEMVFVGEKEILGPLVLDKLYKSGFTSFPVIDDKEQIKGILHTGALNALEVKKTDRAEKYLDLKVNYLKAKDSLGLAVEEISRTNCGYFLVTDESGEVVGSFTIKGLLDYLGLLQ
ncbi:MAG: CBS domain-containing protein [Candidatus Saccharibacteria bacterium]|nr:CBS domain-containing protein [Candidatus Saccharibacteria bacterium]